MPIERAGTLTSQEQQGVERRRLICVLPPPGIIFPNQSPSLHSLLCFKGMLLLAPGFGVSFIRHRLQVSLAFVCTE